MPQAHQRSIYPEDCWRQETNRGSLGLTRHSRVSSIAIMKIEVRKARDLPAKSMEAQDPTSDLGGLSNEITSESPAHDKADISSESEEPDREFRPVDPYLFVKASRKYLSQNPPETSHIADFAPGLSTTQLRACDSYIDKQARAFEYFLVVVTSMYYGDPYCGSKRKLKEDAGVSKGGCRVPRRRKEKGQDNVLGTLISPLRQHFNFEEWTPVTHSPLLLS